MELDLTPNPAHKSSYIIPDKIGPELISQAQIGSGTCITEGQLSSRTHHLSKEQVKDSRWLDHNGEICGRSADDVTKICRVGPRYAELD